MIYSSGGSMVKHRSIAIECPEILRSACFKGVSETTVSALKRRISELDTALGHDVGEFPISGRSLLRQPWRRMPFIEQKSMTDFGAESEILTWVPPVILPTMDGEVCFDHIHFS